MKCGVTTCTEQAQPEHSPCCGSHGGACLCDGCYAVGHVDWRADMLAGQRFCGSCESPLRMGTANLDHAEFASTCPVCGEVAA